MPSRRDDKWARRTPVFLSAFVSPGAGQLMQKRWIAAAIFFFGFLIPFIVLIAHVLICMFHNMQHVVGWDMAPSDKPLEKPSMVVVGLNFLVAMGFYFGGIIDTWAAEMRRLAKRRIVEPPPL
jgi:hypothetical protein